MSSHQNDKSVDNSYSKCGRGRGDNYCRAGFHGKSRSRFFKETSINDGHGGKRTKFEVSSRLKEIDIGVTEFIGGHEHFSGIVKERFGDFHVHEITCNGETAKLTTQQIPPDPEEELDFGVLEKSLQEETLDKIKLIMNPDAGVASVEIDVTDMNKAQRRNVHIIAKKIPAIMSQTVEKKNKKFIVLFKNDGTNRIGYKCYKDIRVDWSRRGGQYCQFVLHKVNMDTMDALNQIAMHLRLKPNRFHYAGTKDRRARTSQWISLKRMMPQEILEAGKRVRGAYVGNFKFVEEPLKLGMLSGNRFTIALRNIVGTDEEIERAMINLRDHGFINYYGLQRFGSVATIPTHEIGKTLLQGKWDDAIDLILKPRPGEQQDMAEARAIYAKTRDASAALKRISRLDKIEAKLLKGIQLSGGKNPLGALDSIPRNARLMYLHSYQSYVWNNIVSRRIREFGCKPIVGDLVYEKSDTRDEILDYPTANESEEMVQRLTPIFQSTSNELSATVSGFNFKSNPVEFVDSEKEVKVERSEVENYHQVTGHNSKTNKFLEEASKKMHQIEDEEKDVSALPTVKILTKVDLPNYTFADVVIPQPGWRVTYPPYAMNWYKEFLDNDGLDIDLRRKNKKYSLGGAYRKILQVPENLSWKIMYYKEIYDELILCDIDELRGNEPPKNNPEGKYKALILEMILKPSTYATMALRELLKHDTSAETQAAQSAAHHAQDKANNEKGEKNEIVIESKDCEVMIRDRREGNTKELSIDTESIKI